jgi:hypothetical protein
MTFKEIGAREGVTATGAYEIYRRALAKIQSRHRKSEFIRLVILNRVRTQQRPKRLAAD